VSSAPAPRRWSVAGDLNGFFGLVVENLAVMAFLATVLVGLFRFAADIVLLPDVSGNGAGRPCRDLAYTWIVAGSSRRTPTSLS
jgi:adenine/guanine/hypoxanthine permease